MPNKLWDTLFTLGFLAGINSKQEKKTLKSEVYSNLGPREEAVFDFFSQDWYTLEQGQIQTGYGEASVSACLRSFRREGLGGFEVKKRYNKTTQVWEYKIVG